MDIMLMGKTDIVGIRTNAGDSEQELEPDQVRHFFCSILAQVKVCGQADIIIDNGSGLERFTVKKAGVQ